MQKRTPPVRLCASVEKHLAVLGELHQRCDVFFDDIHDDYSG
jgi:hypothetical protein